MPACRPLPASVPVRRLTDPAAGHHWFGYYDKLQTSPDDRLVLGMRVDAEPDAPDGERAVAIGVIDTADGDRWTPVGASRAWCWQQGCMLQWVPGSAHEVIWNDREGDRFVARVHDLETGTTRTLPRAVYALDPTGTWAVATDFRRLNDLRPGYGYPGVPDPNREVRAPADSGVWRVDLASGEERLLLSIADLAAMPWPGGDLTAATHYVNHLLVAPDGARVEFLHRWYMPGANHFATRMFTVDPAGGDLLVVDDSGHASHFIWDGPGHILVCCSATGEPALCRIAWHDRALEVVDTAGMPTPDGHLNQLGGGPGRFLITDDGGGGPADGHRHLLLVDRAENAWYELARFPLPERYRGPQRVDLHPRSNRAGRAVIVDAVEPGRGRQLFAVDLGETLAALA